MREGFTNNCVLVSFILFEYWVCTTHCVPRPHSFLFFFFCYKTVISGFGIGYLPYGLLVGMGFRNGNEGFENGLESQGVCWGLGVI